VNIVSDVQVSSDYQILGFDVGGGEGLAKSGPIWYIGAVLNGCSWESFMALAGKSCLQYAKVCNRY